MNHFGPLDEQEKPPPPPPPDLRTPGAELWAALTDSLDFRPDELALLLEICRTKDRLDWITGELVGAPVTVTNWKGDQVANPLLVESRQQGAHFGRLLAQLRIPDDDGTRPQRRAGHRGPQSGRRLYGNLN